MDMQFDAHRASRKGTQITALGQEYPAPCDGHIVMCESSSARKLLVDMLYW